LRVVTLGPDDVSLLAAIDRSEHVDVEYAVVDGQLVERPVTISEIPAWDPVGTGAHSVAGYIDSCSALLAGGGTLLGAFDDDALAGLAIVNPTFEPELAWLAFLHVSRPYRRHGAGRGLWGAAADLARQAGATSMYVSAIPTGSALGFYLSRGCRLADPVHPDLYVMEPEDIHLVCPLT
jgi:GNAT superfamily N-acetyltransferase